MDKCRNGHDRTPENYYIHEKSGNVVCRVCQREYKQKNPAKKRYASKWDGLANPPKNKIRWKWE